MHHIITFIAIAIILFLPSCGGRSKVSATLDSAETLMETDPDSALALLESITCERLTNDDLKALYGLLTVQAGFKTGQNVMEDSLIDISVAHYRKSKDKSNLMKSLFYQGKIRYNLQDYPQAIISAIQSHEMAVDYDDSYWRAKSAELMSDIFCMTKNNSEELRYAQEAASHYLIAGKERNHRFSICDIAIAYYNDDNFQRAIELIDSIKQIASSTPQDSALLAYCERALSHAYYKTGRIDDAFESIVNLSSMPGIYSLSASDFNLLAEISIDEDNLDDGRLYLNLADSTTFDLTDKTVSTLPRIRIYEKEENYREALRLMDSLLNYQNQVVDQLLEQSVLSSQRDYYELRRNEEKQHLSYMRSLTLIIGIFSLLVIISFILFYRYRIKVKNRLVEGKMAMIHSITEEKKNVENKYGVLFTSIKEKEVEIANLNIQIKDLDLNLTKQKNDSKRDMLERFVKHQETIEALFRDKWAMLNMLSTEYFEKGTTPKTRALIVNNVEAEIMKFCDRKNLRQLENSVNEYMNSILKRLREQCPFLTEEEIKFITFVYAGFSSRTICLLTGLKPKGYYSKKSRLADKILSSDAADKAEFASKL